MGDRQRLKPEDMATTSAVSTVPPQTEEEPAQPIAVITLRPTKTQERKKVVWTEDTVDNEDMNKKKSKCCCIYEKPRRFDESSSSESDSDECEHCFGHVEKKKKHRHHHHHHEHAAGTATAAQGGTTTIVETQVAEPTITLKLDKKSEPPPDAEPVPDKPT